MSGDHTSDGVVRAGEHGVGYLEVLGTVEEDGGSKLAVRGGQEGVGLTEDRAVDAERGEVVLVSGEVGTLRY